MSHADRIDDLAARIHQARHTIDRGEQQMGLTLLRLLADGAPVSVERLSETLAVPAADVEQTLEQWPEALRDQLGRVTGYMGLSVAEMGEHRLHLDGRTLSAWCAWDTLFLPELLGETADVTSRCPSTGRPVTLAVTPDGPANLDPPEAVISFLEPGQRFDSNVITSFCRYVHFFASSEAAASWIAEHPGTFELSIDDAYQLARLTNRATFGAALDQPAANWMI